MFFYNLGKKLCLREKVFVCVINFRGEKSICMLLNIKGFNFCLSLGVIFFFSVYMYLLIFVWYFCCG